MKLKAIADQIQYETDVLKGREMKDTTFESQNTYPDAVTASEAFRGSVAKLLNVDAWSNLSSFSADFRLHDQTGRPKPGGQPQLGDYIQIILPGPMPENWVRVVHVSSEEKRVEFTVQPSHNPQEKNSNEIEHFFTQSARSTFRVEWVGNTIMASEIGQQEAINNQGSQAGERAVINTVIAEAGWLFYQKIQWKLLTDYLVHL